MAGNRLRDKISRKKFSRFVSPPRRQKKLEIVHRNLKFSEVFLDEQSRET